MWLPAPSLSGVTAAACFTVQNTKHNIQMFSRILYKQNIRRVVPGTCLVAGGTCAGASPAKVTLSLKLRGGCWRPTSRKVAVFTFQEASGHASSHALLDLEYLFRCSSKPGASDMQVKICVELRRGGKRVARADLEEFLGQLLRGGRPDSFFLYIHEEKVALLQANQPISYPATEWLFEGEARGTHTGVKAEAHEDNGDTDELEECNDEYYEEWKAYLEKVFSVEDEDETDEVKNFNDDNYEERKAHLEEVFAVDDDNEAADEATCELQEASGYDAVKLEDDNDDYNKEWKAYLEEVFAVENDDEAKGEATSEVEEASCEGKEAAGETTSEVEEASDGKEAAGEAISEVEEASGGKEAAGEATSEVEEATGGKEAAGKATSEVEEASGGKEAAGEATSEVEEAAPNGTMAADEDVSHQGEASSAVTVSATPSTASYAYRSMAVPHRFIDRLAGPEDRHLEDLGRSYGVQIVRINRTLHVKGRRDAVLQCHHSMRAMIAEWRSCEAAEAH